MKAKPSALELLALAGFSGVILLSRVPAILSGNELNIDESLTMAQALRTRDIAPWRSIDCTTSGPVSSWFLLALHRAGMPVTYHSVHLVAALCLVFVFLAGWACARRLFGMGPGLLSAGAGAVWLSIPRLDFSHFSSELIPCVLMGAALLCAARPSAGADRARRIRLIVASFLLGTVPWTKLQAAPLAAAIGLFLVAETLARPGRDPGGYRRWVDALSMCASAAAPSVLILAWVVHAGAWDDMRSSYLESSLIYLALPSKGFASGMLHFLARKPISPLLAGIGALFVAGACVKGPEALRFMREKRWEFALAGISLFAGIAVCVSPATQFDHYQLLLFTPSMLAIAAGTSLLVGGEAVTTESRCLSPNWALASACLGLPSLVMGMWFSAAVVNDLRLMGDPREVFPQRQIAEIVREATQPFRTVAIWGWEPCVYVDLGLPPATRHAINPFLNFDSPAAAFLRSRFLEDLRSSRPQVILDIAGVPAPAIAKPELSSSFPALNILLEASYDRVRAFSIPATSRENTRETTIYVLRRTGGLPSPGNGSAPGSLPYLVAREYEMRSAGDP